METPFTHLDGDGRLRMVDVSDKEPTRRRAQAVCVVRSRADIFSRAPDANGLDPVFAARLAGIQAAKRTSQLIPLCHPLNLNDVQVEIEPTSGGATVRAIVVTDSRTGVEMEALTACSVAALSLVNALLAEDSAARCEDLVLERKSGGRSGDWGRLVDSSDEADPR